MHNIVIYYFSGTGNTKRIVDLYRQYFIQQNRVVTLVEISNDTEPVAIADAVGFAYPVHGFNTPEIVVKFAKKLMSAKDVYSFIIKTSGEPLPLNNASSQELCNILAKKGYAVSQEHHYVMPYNMVFRHTDAMASKMLAVAKNRIPKNAQSILDKKIDRLHFPLMARILACLCKIERLAFRLNGRLYKVKKKKCIDCQKCYTSCPVCNIRCDGGKIKFQGNCIGCARCFFNCPADAISIGLLNCIKVNGIYNFDVSTQDVSIGRYCKNSYKKYFAQNS